MKTSAHIKIALITILLAVAVLADDSVRRPAVKQSWKSGSTTFTLLNDGTLTVSGKLGGANNADKNPTSIIVAANADTDRGGFDSIPGIAEDTKNTNGIMGVSWAWIALIILTATLIDIVRRGIRYNQKITKINR